MTCLAVCSASTFLKAMIRAESRVFASRLCELGKQSFMILLLWFVAFLSPIFAFIGAIFLYRRHRLSRPEHRIPALVYAAIMAVCAAVGYFFGMIFGIDFSCAPPAGNLCGLAGVFIIGPLASAGAILLSGSLILLLPGDK